MLPSPPTEMDYGSLPKRKWSDVEVEASRDRTFELENLSNSSVLTFEPVSKLLRAHLPLSWLGTSTANPSLQPGSLLHGKVKLPTAWEYSVLAARQVPNGGLVVLEKIEESCFIVHPLQPFVSEQWIQDASIGAAPPVSMQMMLHYLPSQSEPLSVTVQPPPRASETVLKAPKIRRGAAARLSILSNLEKLEDPTLSPNLQSIPTSGKDTHEAELVSKLQVMSEPAIDAVGQAPKEQHLQEVNGTINEEAQQTDYLSPEYLKKRYLEFLYLTKESVAFYSKGPLNRARARARADNATMTLTELASFYRDSLLPSKKMDLKYKQSLRDAVATIVQESVVTKNTSVKAKKKSSKRSKLGKDGLWPCEIDTIRKWWHKEFQSAVSPDQQEVSLRNTINALRMREAQLQIVLMLEALSIEVKENVRAETSTEPASANMDVKIESVERDRIFGITSEKTAKARNLEADIEILADKLCIWHSIGLEGSCSATMDPQSNVPNDDTAFARDMLRSFCTDVLIVFYNAKLPLICRSICKTLAGPELYEQAQKEARLKQRSTVFRPPGAAIVRRNLSRSGTLECVLSEEDFQLASPPIAGRSSSHAPIPRLKREPSESFTRPSSRQASVSFSNREVDFEAEAQATATKKRKLERVASQKQELAAAIEAMKKPNRQIAGKIYMDEVDLRNTRLKRPVLISATPRTNRVRAVVPARSGQALSTTPVEDLMVPSSSAKNLRSSASKSSSKKRAVLAAIYDTPSRATPKAVDASQPTSSFNARLQAGGHSMKDSHDCVFATPAKPRPEATTEHLTTPINQPTNATREKENSFQLSDMAFKTMERAMAMPTSRTIYDTLGWNDDYE